jgi:hypothetical protein
LSAASYQAAMRARSRVTIFIGWTLLHVAAGQRMFLAV